MSLKDLEGCVPALLTHIRRMYPICQEISTHWRIKIRSNKKVQQVTQGEMSSQGEKAANLRLAKLAFCFAANLSGDRPGDDDNDDDDNDNLAKVTLCFTPNLIYTILHHDFLLKNLCRPF